MVERTDHAAVLVDLHPLPGEEGLVNVVPLGGLALCHWRLVIDADFETLRLRPLKVFLVDGDKPDLVCLRFGAVAHHTRFRVLPILHMRPDALVQVSAEVVGRVIPARTKHFGYFSHCLRGLQSWPAVLPASVALPQSPRP